MIDNEDLRPDPDALLKKISSEEKNKKGNLKIFLGYAAGVGKTYAMLDDAHEKINSGVDVVVGYVEPHTRPETMQLLEGLPALPPNDVNYKNIKIREFDLDAALERKPELILVDELAHTNVEGSRNKKRYQDIEELLNTGIDVYTTVNIQHIESLNDIVQNITKIQVKETIPDYFFDSADKVEIVDFVPEELLKRFSAGKIYRSERVETAVKNFFTAGKLSLLREIALRKAADRISFEIESEKEVSAKTSSVKLLVSVGPSPSSAKCIRWTARTAEAFHAPWEAVYVENIQSERFSDSEKKSLKTNLDLAEQLGGDIITLNGEDIAAAVAEYAKLSGITNIVVGKSRRKKSLWNLFQPDFEDRLISMLPTLEIHIIPGNLEQPRYKSYTGMKLREKLRFSGPDALKTIGVLTAATFLCMGLNILDIGNQNLIMMYILSVLIVSRVTTGYAYGIIASIASVLAFNFFFTVPYFTFNAIQPGYPITFVIMFFAAVITSTSTVRIKTQARLSAEREHRTNVLYEINSRLLATRGLENIVELTNEYLTKLFERSSVFYTKDPSNSLSAAFMQSSSEENASFMTKEDERAVAHWVFLNQKIAGAGTGTLRGAGAFYMPIISQGKVLGVIGISCTKGDLDQNAHLFLDIIASQVAMALERQYLSNEQQRILIDSEKEKMRSNLLRAISHDLRTPLTGILGASSTILENGDKIDKETHDKLISNIVEDSQWLIRMVENLLSVTRINEGTMNVTKTLEAAEEIVSEAISRIRKRFPNRKINVQVPEELLMVPMDGTLIEQVLINLLENAVKHSPDDSVIDVHVKKSGQNAVFEVIDNGEGISEEDFPYLFESYIPNGNRSSDSSRGMGIGLSICMSIVKAHQGKMEAANRKTGGAVFNFELPLERS